MRPLGAAHLTQLALRLLFIELRLRRRRETSQHRSHVLRGDSSPVVSAASNHSVSDSMGGGRQELLPFVGAPTPDWGIRLTAATLGDETLHTQSERYGETERQMREREREKERGREGQDRASLLLLYPYLQHIWPPEPSLPSHRRVAMLYTVRYGTHGSSSFGTNRMSSISAPASQSKLVDHHHHLALPSQ